MLDAMIPDIKGGTDGAEAEAKAVREKAMARLDEAVALVLKEVLP